MVVVSNRLPVNVTRKDGELVFEPSTGGLATAMSSLEASDKIWVGWPGIDADELTADEKELISQELERHGCYPVFLTNKQVELYYEGYANDSVWPLFHYFQSVARYDDQYWKAYEEVNQLFADTTKRVASPSARIWIQDYHLMLLPAMVRERAPGAHIGFFLHIPFPSFEIFRLLPQRKEVLHGLLGADVIGFHVYDYGRHFMSSCLRLLGLSSSAGMIDYDGRMIKIDSYPIGIDYRKFRDQLASPETQSALKQLDDSYKKQKLIISVDRLDYSKGIPQRLEAFRLFLENYPSYKGKVKLLMIAVPSRTGVDAYKSLRDEIEKTVSRINGTYGTVDWAPISYQFQNRPFAEIVALYARADVALITPIRDGMNLVAKEYVASKKRRNGVLILSEMAGAVDELPEALSINPNDSRSIMMAIREALIMPAREQKMRLSMMQKRLAKSTVQQWGKDFINDLAVTGSDSKAMRKLLKPSQLERIATHSQAAARKLIILDYDGTLRSYVKTPSPIAAAPSLRTRRILRQLSDQPNTTVAVVSGRSKNALNSWFVGIPSLKLVAEHGAWTRYDKKWQHIDMDFKDHKKAIKKVMRKYVDRTPRSEIEEKDYCLVWHYTNVEPELAYKRARELQRELQELPESDELSVNIGRDIVEVTPHEVSKGMIVKNLRRQFPADFVLCAGDDYTDEDMFGTLDGDDDAVTIKIGSGDTKARYQLDTVGDMLRLLERLLPATLLSQLPEFGRTLPSKTKKIPKKVSRRLSDYLRGNK